MPEISINPADLPAGLGAAKPIELPATKYRQGGRTMYHVTATLANLPRFIVTKPDPTKPMEGNRLVSYKRSSDFADYVLSREDWVSPALIVNAPKGDIEFKAVQEFPDGSAWGVLSIPLSVLHGIRVLDGQHRTLGTFIALESIEDRIRDKREVIESAKKNGNDEVVAEAEKVLAKLLTARERLGTEHISIDVAEVRRDQATQMFVDIADHAKGINRDLTTMLDQREAVNRVALDLIENHPLLAGRVESGQTARMSAKNPNLVGAKAVADIVRGLNVGTGRVGKRVDDEMAANITAVTNEAKTFLDLLVAAFPELEKVQDNEMTPLELREQTMIGSATMLRVLAVTYRELTKPKADGPHQPMTRAEVEEFFHTLAPHLREMPVAEDNAFWMPSGAFLPGSNAPMARQGSIVQLSRYLVTQAHRGEKSAALRAV